MILLRLFWEFFQTGLFSIGGGLATIPFLQRMGESTGWFSAADLANMIAVSESTPGAMGINMATYVGFHIGGPVGAVVATLGLICPSIIVILVIARFLQSFRQSRAVDAVFYGLRPASTGLIAAAGVSVALIALFNVDGWRLSGLVADLFQWKAIVLAAAVFVCMQLKCFKKLHPVVFIAASAVVGIVFRF